MVAEVTKRIYDDAENIFNLVNVQAYMADNLCRLVRNVTLFDVVLCYSGSFSNIEGDGYYFKPKGETAISVAFSRWMKDHYLNTKRYPNPLDAAIDYAENFKKYEREEQ